ncbi:hypothetical protein ACF0H5_008061 [Mactra antiquata]
MSTVLLMTDTWQPTVLQLVPFSSNNARSQDKKRMRKGQTSARSFPVLAVTRTSATSNSRSDAKSPASHLTELPDDVSVFSETNYSVVTAKTAYTDRTTSSRKTKYAKKRVPDSHSELKEAIKFSVQDLNDQLSSSSSLQSNEIKDDQIDKISNVKLDNTRTKLPKPSMCPSPEAKFCAPVNGVRRSVPLTPGELELQRIRDNYYVEQVQKRKKYKLNVNQLPRSTTPINDHDPDKLNMKQVIAFLQTKTPKDVPKKVVTCEKRLDTSTPNTGNRSPRKINDVVAPPTKRVFYAKDNVKSYSRQITEFGSTDKTLSRPNSDVRNLDKSDQLDNTRLIPGCLSVMSTKSTPNMPFEDRQSKSGKSKSSISVKSYKERSKDRKSLKQKPEKEFKLYRFLAIAPDGKTPGVATSYTEPTREMQTSYARKDSSQSDDLQRKLRQRRSRESGTARVLHRHAITRSNSTPPKIESKESLDENNKTIRLPVMADGDSGVPDVDSDTCSTTSATCNSTKTSSKEEERDKLPKKGKSITFDENIDVKITLKHLNEEIYQNNYSDSPVRTYKTPAFPRVNISGPRQIHVNVPQEQKKYSQEIVRLTLRQDKNATRVTSYMSDIQNGPPKRWHERYGDSDDGDTSVMTSSDLNNNNYENREWLESSRQFINTISNNNFIKVRQKLKSSNMYGGD